MAFWNKIKTITKAVPVGIAPDFMTNKAVWSNWNTDTAVREGYKSVAWVFAAVKLRSAAVASVPLKVERYINGEWVCDERHPLQKLIDCPNPDLDRSEMMRLFVTHLDLSGNAYQLKTRATPNGAPLELYPLMPQHVKVVAGRERLIAAYEYLQNGKTVYAGMDVVHCALTNPDSLYYGMSPLEAAGKAVDIDNAASSWQKISMQNRGVPDGVFTFDADMSYEQWEEARATVREQYTGIASSRAPWVLSKAKYQQMSMTPAEMDFMATREFSMNQICAVYGVPREMISGMGDVNRASGENVRRSFWLDTIMPLLSEVESTLNLCLAREFGTADQIRIRFDTSSVPALQENYTEKVNNAKTLFSMGVPFNNINKLLELGFDDIEGGDAGYLPSGVIPASLDFAPDQLADAKMAYGSYENKAFSPPDGVKQAAKQGLEYRQQYGRGGTAVGLARARDLSNGKNVSEDTIGRMVSFFARHEQNRVPPSDKKEPDGGPTNGWIAWLLWGGDAGRTWSNKILRQIDDE